MARDQHLDVVEVSATTTSRQTGLLRGNSRAIAIAAVGTATLTRYALDLTVSRGAGAAAFGDYALVSTIALAMASVAGVGLPELANRQVPLLQRAGRHGAARSFLRVGVVTSVGVGLPLGAGAALVLHAVSSTETATTAAALLALVPAGALFTLRRQAALLGRAPLLGLFAPALVWATAAALIATIGAVSGSIDALRALVVLASTYLCFALVSVRVMGGRGRDPGSGAGFDEVKAWLRSGATVLSSNVATLLTSFMDIFMVSLFASRVDTGIYAASSRMALVVTLVLAGIMPREGPRFGRLLAAGDTARCKREYVRACTISGLFGVLALATLLAAGPYLLALFGAGFAAGYPALCILAAGRCASAITGPAATLLIVMGHSFRSATGAWTGFAVALVLMLALQASLGFLGIAIGAAVGMAVQNVIQLGFVFLALKRLD